MANGQWHYTKDGQQTGPVNADQLRQLVGSGQLGPDDYVWQEGTADWVKVSAVPELMAAATSPSPGQPAAVGQPAGAAPPAQKGGMSVLTILAIVFGCLVLVCGGGIALLLPSLASARERARFLKWKGYSHNLRVDTSNLAYFDFEGQEEPKLSRQLKRWVMFNRASGDPFLQAKFDTDPDVFDAVFPEEMGQRPQWESSKARWKGKGALRFDGKASPEGDYLTFANRFYHNEDFTVITWIKPGSTHDGCITAFADPETDGLELSVSGDAVHCRMLGQTLSSPVLLSDQNWHLITVVIDTTTAKITLYVDATPHDSSDFTGKLRTGDEEAGDVYIGRKATQDAGYFHGMIDELGYFNRPLDNTEIATFYKVGRPTP